MACPMQHTLGKTCQHLPRRTRIAGRRRIQLTRGRQVILPRFSAQSEAPMQPLFQCRMKVRDYEIDQFQVVNNAVYSQYLQHARHEFLEHLGLESVERLIKSGAVLALSELRIRFLAPLRCGDAFIGTVRVTRAAGARAHMQQQLLLLGSAEPQVVVTAEVVVVYLDQSYRPQRLPKRIRQLMLSGQPGSDAQGLVSWTG